MGAAIGLITITAIGDLIAIYGELKRTLRRDYDLKISAKPKK